MRRERTSTDLSICASSTWTSSRMTTGRMTRGSTWRPLNSTCMIDHRQPYYHADSIVIWSFTATLTDVPGERTSPRDVLLVIV